MLKKVGGEKGIMDKKLKELYLARVNYIEKRQNHYLKKIENMDNLIKYKIKKYEIKLRNDLMKKYRHKIEELEVEKTMLLEEMEERKNGSN